MGKGKGSFLRRCILIKKQQPILFVSGIPLIKIIKFRAFFEKRINFRLSIIQNSNTTVTPAFSPKTNSLFYKKTFFL